MSTDFLCVYCAEVVQSQSFRKNEEAQPRTPGMLSPSLSDYGLATASSTAATKEMFSILNALSANPPRRYAVNETHYYSPSTKSLLRVQRVVDGGSDAAKV